MTVVKEIIKNLPAKAKKRADNDEPMADPDYLHKSLKLINECLQRGMDVLQLENGDVETAHTQVITTRYRWDAKNRQMVRVTSRSGRKRKANALVKE